MQYPRVSLYAFMLSAAGIPLYIHLPRFASMNLGIGLGALGTLLLLIRLVDLVQDPAIGWAIDRWPQAQLGFAMAAAAGLAVGFPLLFGAQDGTNSFMLAAILVLLFSAYSLGSILLYGRSSTLAGAQDEKSLLSIAAYREGGMLAGVVLATLAPTILVIWGADGQGYPAFGILLACIAVAVAFLTVPIWRRTVSSGLSIDLTNLRSVGATKLLLIALINSLPVAITSTLFLFFVEDRLQLEGLSGPLLLLFFVCAGATVPIWAGIAKRSGGRKTLLIAMPFAIIGFSGAAFLGPGDLWPFAFICLISGAALGADLVVLPAMYSIALTQRGLNASTAFGLWSFAGKLGLALSAFLVLPLLERSGFVPGASNNDAALGMLTLNYAVLPCFLKIVALALVFKLPQRDSA